MNSQINNSNTALLLIDVQKGFTSDYWGKRNNPDAEEKINRLLHLARNKSFDIFHIQHISTNPLSPLKPNQIGVEFMDFITPLKEEVIDQKNVNSAFIGTKLNELLKQKNIQKIIAAGFTSDHCVCTTSRMASNLGYEVIIIADACVTFNRTLKTEAFDADLVHKVSLASLDGEFASVMNLKEFKAQL